MRQTARIISTYSADVMGVCSALFELGGMVVIHDPSGCNSTYTTHDEPRWYDIDSMIYISGLSEIEAIMGDDEKLIGDITEAAAGLGPAFIAIAGSPVSAMTGFDAEAVASLIEKRTGIPAFGLRTTGMDTYIRGASEALAAVAGRFVRRPREQRSGTHGSGRLRANILGLTPLDFSVSGSDRSIAAWLSDEGFDVVSKWAMGSSLEELGRAAEADVDLVVSAAGFGAARVLYEKFGIPYAVGVPIGNELPGLLADTIRMKVPVIRSVIEKGPASLSFEAAEIGVDTGVFSGGAAGRDGSTHDKGFVAVIGEGIASLSLAGSIEMECGVPAKVLCPVGCPQGFLRECDVVTPDEESVIRELAGAGAVIADPLYEPVIPAGARFLALPHEAFSGRIYRGSIPDLVADPGSILGLI